MAKFKFINNPVNVRSKIDGINGSNKSYLRQKMCMKVNIEANNEIMRLNATLLTGDNNKKDETQIFSEGCIKLSSSKERIWFN